MMADADRFDLSDDPISNEEYGELRQQGVPSNEPCGDPNVYAADPAELLPLIAAAHGHGSAGVIGQAGARSVLDALAAGGFKVVRA